MDFLVGLDSYGFPDLIENEQSHCKEEQSHGNYGNVALKEKVDMLLKGQSVIRGNGFSRNLKLRCLIKITVAVLNL